MKKNLLLIGKILCGFVLGCLMVLATVLCLTTFLGLTGCSMNVPLSTMVTYVEQNKVEHNYIEWIDTNDESRAAISLDSVTFEEYKVPKRKGKYIFEERAYRGVKGLERGGKIPVTSAKDYNYESVTQVRCIEFNYSFVFDSDKDKIKLHDYEGDIVMEVANYYGVPLEHDEAGWILDKGIIHYRGEGWEIKYVFLNENAEAMSRFYNEHKYEGRFEWNN